MDSINSHGKSSHDDQLPMLICAWLMHEEFLPHFFLQYKAGRMKANMFILVGNPFTTCMASQSPYSYTKAYYDFLTKEDDALTKFTLNTSQTLLWLYNASSGSLRGKCKMLVAKIKIF